MCRREDALYVIDITSCHTCIFVVLVIAERDCI